MDILQERNSECWYKDVCLADASECQSCIKFAEMQHLMETSNLPKAKQKPILLDCPPCDLGAYRRLAEIKSNIVDFVESGKTLYIASSMSGNGKTSWAIKLMLKYFDEIWAGNGFNTRALFVSVPTFLLKCKDFKVADPSFDQLKRDLLKVDLVIWDDIASTNISAYDYSQLLMFLDARALNGQSNIYTGNYETLELLQERIGMKLASRVWSSSTEVIIFKGGDMR